MTLKWARQSGAQHPPLFSVLHASPADLGCPHRAVLLGKSEGSWDKLGLIWVRGSLNMERLDVHVASLHDPLARSRLFGGRGSFLTESPTLALRSGRQPTQVLCTRHAGPEGWKAEAPGGKETPLHWAKGKIYLEQEPVDFIAPGRAWVSVRGVGMAVTTWLQQNPRWGQLFKSSSLNHLWI